MVKLGVDLGNARTAADVDEGLNVLQLHPHADPGTRPGCSVRQITGKAACRGDPGPVDDSVEADRVGDLPLGRVQAVVCERDQTLVWQLSAGFGEGVRMGDRPSSPPGSVDSDREGDPIVELIPLIRRVVAARVGTTNWSTTWFRRRWPG